MGKIRRGNYIFVSWVGDHGHHVHVYRDGKLVLKWDLDENRAIKGRITGKLRKLINQLRKEGLL
ncbi:MAG: hypothetical protein A3G34_16760 [Candidatus Lindowbacteria bacterium RIFCSPLOWO2_12_FULL_62_27]|nr:MAG: hypothetical protein A3G34_16760 [Candidatus Lindowbacteria bacterium RIFCSPLOWO2_12_FULL_62_27]